MTLTARQTAGNDAEALAERFLRNHGLTIEARNVRSRFGEIDLVARDRETLVFVEVRMRREGTRGGAFGGALESISAAKRSRIQRAALAYLARERKMPACRFDAVLLDGLNPERIEWIKGAFNVEAE